MTKPLALIVYESLLPGRQVVSRFEDLGYRVETLSDASGLVTLAEAKKPLVVVVDLDVRRSDAVAAIKLLREHPSTSHVPVIAFGRRAGEQSHAQAHAAGAAIVVNDTTIVPHLAQFLEQALQLD
jgi:CheY-like chemotaxis protein